MAKIPPQKFILVAFLLLCFVSTSVKAARTLRVASKNEVEKATATVFKPDKGNALPDVDDLVGMDYTPARKKPPIHN